jgi:O-antigen/teichoic acid export membrane protein
MGGYIALADARSMGTLKFTLAVRQHVDDVEEKRRQVGAAIVVWFMTLPLLAVAGGVAVWGIPRLIETSNPHAVQLAMAIVVIAMALERLTSLPRHLLRGLNLDYRAMGLDGAAVVLGGLLGAVAIWSDLGLPGVAAATFVGMLLFNGVRFFVARRAVPWFGASRPSRAEVRTFMGLTGWLVFGEFAGLLVAGGDIVIAGLLLGPQAAALYAATSTVPRMALGPLSEFLSAGGPGIYGLCGQKEWERVALVRNEQQILGLGLLTLFAPVTIAVNASFIDLWVGRDFYAGNAVTAFLVMATVFAAVAVTDQTIADATFAFRQRAVGSLFGGLLMIVVAVSANEVWGLPGVALGILVGRLVVAVYSSWLIARRMEYSLVRLILPLVRSLACTLSMCGLGLVFASRTQVRSWEALVAVAALWVLASLAAFWVLGMNRGQRAAFFARVRLVADRSRPLPPAR